METFSPNSHYVELKPTDIWNRFPRPKPTPLRPGSGTRTGPLTSAKRRQFCSRICATKHAWRAAGSQT
jgi:hypothetical protein